MRYTRSEIGSMKGRSRNYRKKAMNGDCTEGEYERGMKDKRRAEIILRNGSPSPGEVEMLREIVENVQEMAEAFGAASGQSDHEFGISGGVL